MKAWINNIQVSGSPREIAELLSITTKPAKYVRKLQQKEVPLSESQMLRQTLANNPNYSPYPGVLPGEDQLLKSLPPQPGRNFSAEEDTGVQH